MHSEEDWKTDGCLGPKDCQQQHKVQLEASHSCTDPQGLMLGQILFNVFINGRGDGTVYPQQVCWQYKTGGAADTPNGCAIQRNLGRLKNWPEEILMKFNKGEWKILYLGRNNPVHQQLPEAECLGSSFGRNGVRLPEDTKLNMRNVK